MLKSNNAEIELSHHRAESFYLKLVLGTLFGLVLLIALSWGGHDLYVRWQERRLVRQAVFSLEHGKDRDASLAARCALDFKPTSTAAMRIVAQLAERAGDRTALVWRRKVVQREPESTQDKLTLARCGLQFKDLAAADRALSEIDADGKHLAGYHAVAALLAQARDQNEEAESEWAEALRVAPNERAYQLQLGILQIHELDPQRHASGQAMLKALRNDPAQRAAATRALINEGVARHEDAQQLMELARELQAYLEATLNDRLLFLDFLRQLQNTQFSSYLAELEKSAAAKPDDLAALLAWMSQNNLNLLALDFVKRLPAESAKKWPVPLAVADIYARLKDWRTLEQVMEIAQWQQFDFLRHAYMARALRELEKPAAAEHEWATAVKGASGQADAVLLLIRTTSEWNWKTETLDMIWALAKYPEKQDQASQTLYRHYAATGDMQGLYRVLLRMAEIRKDDPFIKNNLAQLSLLLNLDLKRAQELAKEVYDSDSKNPIFASTYGYSLYVERKYKDASRVMSRLSPTDLREPEIAAYYGVILAGAGEKEKARQYLDMGKQARLLPAERELLEKTVKSLSQ